MADERRPELPPMRTNDVLVAAIGTVAWAIALVVLLIAGAPEGRHWWVWVCVAGICIGVFGMWYMPRIQRSRDAQLARNAARARRAEGETPES
jgi:hypothetical protein